MRISVLEDDIGYHPLARRQGVKVFLDGKPQRNVFTADDVKGEVLVATVDEEGYIRPNNKEWRYGKVQIVLNNEIHRKWFDNA